MTTRRLLALALLSLAVPAAQAQGAVFGGPIGASLDTHPSGNAQITLAQSGRAGANTLQEGSPSGGALTQIRLAHGPVGANPGGFGIRLLGGTDPSYTARTIPGYSDASWHAGDAAGVMSFTALDAYGRPHGTPVSAGTRLGLRLTNTTAGTPHVLHQDGSATLSAFGGGVDDGLSHSYAFFGGDEITLQATVEADADGDGYGDETQDSCPADPSGPCRGREFVTTQVPVVQVQTVIREVPAAAKKTTKKCRKGYALKKKKCVKKKKRGRRTP